MIPEFIYTPKLLWPILPPGIWPATMEEIEGRFAVNPKRLMQFHGLKRALSNLFEAGCTQVYLDGSYITAKPLPNDYEVCWRAEYVDPDKLDYVFFDSTMNQYNQKKKYLGEFFPDFRTESRSGMPFLDFFQHDKVTGVKKGIISIENYLIVGRANDN
jgi:hypothetical protein